MPAVAYSRVMAFYLKQIVGDPRKTDKGECLSSLFKLWKTDNYKTIFNDSIVLLSTDGKHFSKKFVRQASDVEREAAHQANDK